MIGHWSLRELIPLLDGHLAGSDAAFTRVTTDSRKVGEGDLFVALRGAHFDGHDFVGTLAAAGVSAALVEKVVDPTLPQMVVKNTVMALGQLGWINRRRFNGQIVAITGSNGKTTVKEMIAAILAGGGPVCKTMGNLNNHLGVPLSLLSLTEKDRFGVFELGASHGGEIAYTVRLVDPDVAVLVNAGDAHLEGFGSRQGVAEAKGEIVAGLSAQGTAILNRDSPFYSQWRTLAGLRRVVSFGLQEGADVRASDIQCHLDRSEFNLHLGGRVRSVRIPMTGLHNVTNSLAATAAASALGIDPETIVAGLAAARSLGGRLRQVRSSRGALVIDDTYNASPASMKAALDVLSGCSGTRIAVLGHMAELGTYAAESHFQVGEYARGKVDDLWVMGSWARDYANGFGSNCRILAGVDEAVALLRERLDSQCTVLVKGSRSAAMERVVNGIVAEEHGAEGGKA